MEANVHDPGLDALLYLDGETFVVDSGGKCWVKFEVKQCAMTAERPQGLRYSLTLHDETGSRLLGFDNAHPIREGSGPGARTRIEYDHKHRGPHVRFYVYEDAATLLADFWIEVELILERRSSQYEHNQRLEGRNCITRAIQGSDDGDRAG
ncbi:toxin-antitoxin system TumE family protein [Trinickia soli]|uniref:toxin-antitoxin system TumE family protein n=1 Tax=Trinickia soli TaxID=380675 RepID=UPI001468D324|nr:DUF6516 family protein [Trinickia soli]CAB3684159.1 hypothetical protein LMG24076_02590 [Trinickia soli]